MLATLDQTVIAAALTAALATGRPGALADEWRSAVDRLEATDTPVEPGLEAHYYRLTHPEPPTKP